MRRQDVLVLVDEKDKVIGSEKNLKCHQGSGLLHRAVSVFIFNKKGECLIQKRGTGKLLWPLYWTNSCCTHPPKGESYQKTAERRIAEEMGISCRLKFLFKFRYRASYKNNLSENELTAVFFGIYDGKIRPDQGEISQWQWVPIEKLKKDIEDNPDIYTPWFKKLLPKALKKIDYEIPLKR